MKQQGFIKGSAILLAMVIITKALGLIYKVPLANILGGTGMGYFSAAFSVFTPLFSIAAAGIPSAMSRLAAENAALGRYANLRKQKRTAHICFGLLSLAVCGAMIAGAAAASYWGSSLSGTLPLICIAPSVVFCSIMNVERGYYEGLGNMTPTAVSEITESLFKMLLGLGLAIGVEKYAADCLRSSGVVFGIACKNAAQAHEAALPYIAAAAVLGSTLASGIAAAGLLTASKLKGDGVSEKMLRSDPVTDSFGRHAKGLIRLSFKIALAAVIMTLTGMVDMLTIPRCISAAYKADPAGFKDLTAMGVKPEKLGDFMYGCYEGMAMLIMGLVPTLTAMLGKSALSLLCDAAAKGNKPAFTLALERMLKVSAVIAVPSGLGICVLSRQILEVQFSSRPAEVAAATAALSILGLAAVFFAAALPCFTVIQTLGRGRRLVAIIAVSGAVKLALNLLLIRMPHIGLSGAAWSELVSSALTCILTLREVTSMCSGRISIMSIFVKPLYCGLLCAVSARLCNDLMGRMTPMGNTMTTACAICSGGIMYFISLYLLCETPKNLINCAFCEKK